MSDDVSSNFKARDAILTLLTDDEVAKVSSAEGGPGLQNGDQYLDLTHLERGVQTAGILNKVKVGDVIPRNAVSPPTWQTITTHLSR